MVREVDVEMTVKKEGAVSLCRDTRVRLERKVRGSESEQIHGRQRCFITMRDAATIIIEHEGCLCEPAQLATWRGTSRHGTRDAVTAPRAVAILLFALARSLRAFCIGFVFHKSIGTCYSRVI